MKKLVILVSISIIFIFPVRAAGGFIDVGTQDAYRDAVYYAYQNGIVNGYSDMTFRPDNQITRGEFTKIIVNSALSEDERNGNCYSSFSDVISNPESGIIHPFAFEICYAKGHNIVSGFSDGTFRPNNYITVGEASKIIVNAFKMIDQSNIQIDQTNKFRAYLQKLVDLKAIPSEIKSQENSLTRGQMVEIIYRIKNNITNKSFTDLLYSSIRSGRIEFAGKSFIYDMPYEVESIERNGSNISIWMFDGSKFDLDYIINDYGFEELHPNLAINAVLNYSGYQCVGDENSLSVIKTGIENIYNYSIVKSSENCASDGQNENYHMKVYEDRSNDSEIVQFMFSGIIDDSLDFDSLLRMEN